MGHWISATGKCFVFFPKSSGFVKGEDCGFHASRLHQGYILGQISLKFYYLPKVTYQDLFTCLSTAEGKIVGRKANRSMDIRKEGKKAMRRK